MTVLRSSLPHVREIMVLKYSMLRKPLAWVLMFRMMPFNPSRIAFVHGCPKWARMSSKRRRTSLANAFMGSSLECIIHEHRRLSDA